MSRSLSRVLVACLTSLALSGPAPGQAPPAGENLVVNGGFEEDNFNLRGEKMSCPVRPRVTYGQRDAMPDGWANATRVPDGHTGAYALRLLPANSKAPVTATLLPYAVHLKGQEQEFRDARGQAFRGPALPPLHFSAWVKGGSGKDGLAVTLTLSVQENDPKAKKENAVVAHTVRKDFLAPAAWTQVAFDVPAAELAAALRTRPQPVGLVTAALSLQPTTTAQGITVDDVELRRPEQPVPYTLVPNAGFESGDKDGRPAGWTPVKKSLRYFGQTYYVWRDWFHFFGEPRGANALDSAVARGGTRSFRMNVPPGDDKHIESPAIALNQKEPGRLTVQFDYNSYLLANLMVQVVDQEGKEVFGQNLVPGTSGGWQTFRAEFLPRRAALKPGAPSAGGDLYGPQGDPVPLQSCRVRLGAKGVNGSAMDDINEWVNVHHAGVLWLDNVVLAETGSTAQDLAARGLKTYPPDPRNAGLTVEALDLGERLFGENQAAVTLANGGAAPARGTVTLTLTGPYKERDPKKAGYALGAAGQDTMEPEPEKIPAQQSSAAYSVAPGGRATVTLPYTITRLLEDWRSEYRVQIALDKDRSFEIPLGTWSQQALVEVEKCYAFPEDKVQPVFLNVGVARKTLGAVDRLRLEVRRARDDKPVLARDVPNFAQAAAGFGHTPLPEGFEGDSTNFFRTELPIDALPVHPQTRPVRDHYVHAAGLDRQGQVVFEGRSPRFGRMEAHAEKLEAVKDVRVHPDNYLLVNGKPLFCRGQIWMQQNFGPAPLARQNTDWKKYGFNVRAGTQAPLPEADSKDPRFAPGLDQLWAVHNTYLGSQMIAPKGPLTPAVRADLQKWLAKPNVLGIHFIPWEGSPQGSPGETVQYAEAIKDALGTRPLWVSAGWYEPAVCGELDNWKSVLHHDWFMPENNSYLQPSQLDREIAPRKRGKPHVLGTYPNVFNDAPYNVQRFEHWTEIIRGHTGYMQIGKPGDPTLMAGLNGEFRFMETFLFGKDAPPAVSATPAVEHRAWGAPKASYLLASNAGPIIGGDWEWNRELKDKGKASHTGTALWSRLHDYMKDYYSHWYKGDRPVRLVKGDKLVQYVYLPAGAKVEGLVLMARGDALWRHNAVWGAFNHQAFTDSGARMWLAKDMHQMSWGTLNLGFCGPEGHDIKHPELLKHAFTADQFHTLGGLPPAGAWVRLEVPAEKVGLDGREVDGLGFLSKGAKVWWERTLLVHDGKETVLCDGSVGIPPDALKKVRFNVAGLKAGTKVQVCFEEREVVAGDGYFEDDLSGEPGYRNLWVGLYGDKLGETGYYGDGVFYNYNWGKVAARLYEIPR